MKSAVRVELDRMLADGEWHDIEHLCQALTPLVPPGVAIRRYRRITDNGRRVRGVTKPYGSRVDPVRAGARVVVSTCIYNAIRNGTAIERSGDLVRCVPRGDKQ